MYRCYVDVAIKVGVTLLFSGSDGSMSNLLAIFSSISDLLREAEKQGRTSSYGMGVLVSCAVLQCKGKGHRCILYTQVFAVDRWCASYVAKSKLAFETDGVDGLLH